MRLGMKREINEDDIYAVTNDMRSDKNTEAFENEWQLELEKKNPSLVRVIMKLYGYRVITISTIVAVVNTLVR